MSKYIIPVFGVAIVLLSSCTSLVKTNNLIIDKDNSVASNVISNTSTSRYQDFSQEKYDQVKGKDVVLFFHANWCSWCRRMDRDLVQNIEKFPENTIIFKLNFDKEIELRKKYSVTNKDTYVFLDSTEKVVSVKQSATLDDLKNYFVTKTVSDTVTQSPTGYGMYREYDSEIEKTFSGKKPYALFFHATWCPACKKADQEIVENLAKLPGGTAVFKVDYDTEMELRKKYKITSQHTLVHINALGEAEETIMGFTVDDIKRIFTPKK